MHETLNILDLKERSKSSMITENMFNFFISKDIDCVGCKIHLQNYIQELLKVPPSMTSYNPYEGLVINNDSKLRIK